MKIGSKCEIHGKPYAICNFFFEFYKNFKNLKILPVNRGKIKRGVDFKIYLDHI